jgi:hypothetical protein
MHYITVGYPLRLLQRPNIEEILGDVHQVYLES